MSAGRIGSAFSGIETISLDDLDGVTIVTASDGQILQYNSTTGEWENQDLIAEEVAITDAGSYYTGTDVETALQEAGENRLLMPPVEDWHDPTGGLPVDPLVGDRYISEATAGGWTTDYIYEWDGDEWIESVPTEGWMVWMLLEFMFYVFFSGGWTAIDHGSLIGLTDDDHPQYLLVDGTRAMTGELDMGTNKIVSVVDPTADQEAATKKYVDDNTGVTSIPEVTSDPGSPSAEDAWVLKSGGVVDGVAGSPRGLLLALTYTGTTSASNYQFSYETSTEGTKRVPLT